MIKTLRNKKKLAAQLMKFAAAAVTLKERTTYELRRKETNKQIYSRQFDRTEAALIKTLRPFFKDQIDSAIEKLKGFREAGIKSYEGVKCGGPGGTMGPCPTGGSDKKPEFEVTTPQGLTIEMLRDKVKEIFGHDKDEKDLIRAAGATSGSKVSVSYSPYTEMFSIKIDHPQYRAERKISRKSILNEEFEVKKEERAKGLGTKVFHQQVTAASRLGMESIQTSAVTGGGLNGGYTWARLGYDGDLSRFTSESQEKDLKKKFPEASKISDLMKSSEGRIWWRDSRNSFNGTFDLAEGSQSRRVLDAYVKEQESRTASGIKSGGGRDSGWDLGSDWEGRKDGTTATEGIDLTLSDIFNPEEWNDDLINRTLPVLAKAMAEASIAQYLELKDQIKRKKSWIGRKCGGPGGTMGPCPAGHSRHVADSEAKKRSEESWTPPDFQFNSYGGQVKRTEQEQEAVKSWTFVKKAKEVNDHLRIGNDISDEGARILDGLNSLMSRSSLPGDVTSYRGVSLIGGIEGVKIGSFYHDKGFSATTLDKSFAKKHAENTASGKETGAGRLEAVAGDPVVFKVFLPKGSRVTPGAQSALELLIDRDSSFRVVSKSKSEVFVVLEQGDSSQKSTLTRTKASTATEWLESIDDDDPEELQDVVFTTPYGNVTMGILTEYPAWMKSSIEDRLSETFSEPYWDEISQTTGGDINEVLRKGLIDGWSIEDMADEMNERFGDQYSLNRGRLIARTESGNALNAARSAVIDQLISDLGMQDVIKKIWLSVLGNTTRDTHAHLDGVPADKDGCWALGGIRCRWPSDVKLPAGERVNCQCTVYTQLGMTNDTADELIADAEIRQLQGGKSVYRQNNFFHHRDLELSFETKWSEFLVKCGGEGGTMGPCPGGGASSEWKPSMSKTEAQTWAKGSTYKKELFHVTTGKDSALSIRNEGFRSDLVGSGKVFGTGSYFATDSKTTSFYKKLTKEDGYSSPETISAYVRVKKILDIDTSAWDSSQRDVKIIPMVAAKHTGLRNEYLRHMKEIGDHNNKILQSHRPSDGGLGQYKTKNGWVEHREAESFKRAIIGAGYDSIRIKDNSIDPAIGGNQLVVFNQKSIVVVDPSQKSTLTQIKSLNHLFLKCNGPLALGGTMGPCPAPKVDSTGKYIPGAVGQISGVNTSSWKKDDATAQWALKKIAKMEEMAEKGEWNNLTAVGIPKSNYGKYSKAFDEAMQNLSKQKSDKLEVLPPPMKPSSDPTVATDQGWKKVGGKLGTEAGGTYEMGGKKFYVKTPEDVDRARNENLALKLYGLAGASAKESNLVLIDGKPALATEWVDSKKVDWNDPSLKAKAAEDFAVHVWLNNRDAVGAGSENPMDNIQQKKDGSLVMLDAGGSLDYKGMGGSGKKPFTDEPGEWDSFRDKSTNPSMYKVFGDMTHQQLADSAKKLSHISNDQIKSMVEKHGNGGPAERAVMALTLIKRRDSILKVGKECSEIAEEKKQVNVPPKPSQSTELEPLVDLQFKPMKAAIPPPPQIMEGKTKDVGWYQNFQNKFNAIHAAAEKGDIEAVKDIKVSETSTDTYTKKVLAYKKSALSALGAGGEATKPTTIDQKIKDTFNKTPKEPIKIDTSKFSSTPNFVSSNKDQAKWNTDKAAELKKMAEQGDLVALKAEPHFKSPKLTEYKNSLISEVATQLNPLPKPRSIHEDFSKLSQNISGKPTPGVTKIGEWAVLGSLNGVKNGIPVGKWDTVSTTLFKAGDSAYSKTTSQEKTALKSYTGSGYHSMNSSLRKGSPTASALNAANALMKKGIPLPEGQMLSRKHTGVDWSGVQPGTVVSDRGILSTSVNSGVWGGQSQLMLSIGPGVRGLPAKSFSHHKGESEVLLPPNQRIMITRVEKKNSTSVVYGVILPTQDSQCCPP